MALPYTTGLTLHWNASANTNLFKTADAINGNHSGNPSDGETFLVWDDEGDGIADVSMQDSDANSPPTFRSGGSSLMLHSCVDFNGTDDYLRAYNQRGTAQKALSNFITNSAYYCIVAFYAEAITTTGANLEDNHCIIGDDTGYFGLFLKDVSGTKTAYAFNYDGSNDQVGVACAAGATHIAEFRHDSGNLYLAIDGGTESSVASGNTSNLTHTLLFGKSAGATSFLNGRIGEGAIYNAVPASGDRSSVYSYFSTNWLGASFIARQQRPILQAVTRAASY